MDVGERAPGRWRAYLAAAAIGAIAGEAVASVAAIFALSALPEGKGWPAAILALGLAGGGAAGALLLRRWYAARGEGRGAGLTPPRP